MELAEQGWICKEAKRVSLLAAPMVVVSVIQHLMMASAFMMAGHLGELQLSGVSVASCFTNATGFSVLFGMSGALETLCGQAHGAGQDKKIATFTYTAIPSIVSMCLPISVLWVFMDRLLIAIGFDPLIARVACRFSMASIPALFGYAFLQSLIRYFQSQRLTLPVFVASIVAICVHVPLCWALTFKCHLGYIGSAISLGVAYWVNAILLALYMGLSPACKKTRSSCLKDVFSALAQFSRLAFSSAGMTCLEWWTFEILVLVAGRLPDAKLETSVLSICMTAVSLNYFVQYGIGAAASTRVSNELGAGNPKAAQSAVWVVLGISMMEATMVSAGLFCARNVFGYAFSNNKQVVKYVSQMAPLLSGSIIADSLQASFSGITRGCGLQRNGACINLGAYYLVGIPMAMVLCFVVHLRSKGLWTGALTGTVLQASLFALITVFLNWKKQATKAKKRVFQDEREEAGGAVNSGRLT